MDSLIAAAARALQAGDILGALKRVALREDAPALALRGIALAQLGDFERARALLKRAEQAFGPREVVARARCVVAQAEIALVSRDLGRQDGMLSGGVLAAARQALAARGDRLNAAHAGHLEIRLMVLLGRLDQAERLLADLDPAPFPPAARAAHELVVAGIAVRRLDIGAARQALARAQAAADHAPIAALRAEVAAAARLLDAPAARRLGGGAEARMLRLDEVEALLAGPALIVDACRHVVRQGGTQVGLASRPVLFALARTLAEAWPADAGREALLAGAFRAREADESHRARLRVEIGRLRRALRDLATITATRRGFMLVPRGQAVVVLAPPVEDDHAAVLALLADGEAWSSSALALALGASQRTVQRALEALRAAGKAQAHGSGRARRWIAPPLGFTTTLLLPGPLPAD